MAFHLQATFTILKNELQGVTVYDVFTHGYETVGQAWRHNCNKLTICTHITIVINSLESFLSTRRQRNLSGRGALASVTHGPKEYVRR